MDGSKQSAMVYDKIADKYAETFGKQSEYIDEFLGNVTKNGMILDVGCGSGVDANYMSSKGYRVIGVDLSKEMIRLAKEKFRVSIFS